MAGKTISEFNDAGALQGSDYFLIDRGSSTLKVSGSTVTNSITSNASGAFASKTDLTSLSSTVDTNFALKTSITSLSSTVDNNFILKPASASAQQVLTYNGSTTTWVASAAPNGSTGPTAAKAWVNFDGTLATPITPRAQYNISSVTKSGTGSYTINFATPMADANYVFVSGAMNRQNSGNSTGDVTGILVAATNTASLKTTTQLSIGYMGGGSAYDGSQIHVAIFGN